MLVINEDLTARLSKMDEAEFRTYLFLEPHPLFPNQWTVNSSDPTFVARMGRIVKDHKAVSPLGWTHFEAKAAEEGYKVVFLVDPTPNFDWVEGLNATPTVTVNSTMEGTVNGMLKFQVHGFNFVKDLMSAILQHSTGTGKTVTASALNKHHEQEGNYDLCIWAVKTHNRINTQRALKRNVGLDSVVVDGTKRKRYLQYAEAAKTIEDGGQAILVINYEKLRDDAEAWKLLVTGRKVLVVWDEMPTKLRNRTIKLYRAACEIFYTSSVKGKDDKPIFFPQAGRLRPSELRQIMLSATPIENGPEDWFNCVRLLDPTVYGSVKKFRDTFVARYDYWGNIEQWQKLDMMGAMAAHITHQVDKADPDIAALFPKIREEEIVLDMHEADRKLYNKLTDEYRKLLKKGDSKLDHDEILAAIGVLQMLCNNPRAVLVSASQREEYLAELELDDDAKKKGGEVALKLVEMVGDDSKFTDEIDGEPRNAKLARLQDDLASGEKTVIFTAYNSTNIPYIKAWLEKWGVGYVVYDGTKAQMQAAEDSFRDDPNVQVFLSSDRGSDSINLEVASLVINYDLPWKWSTKIQRQNRIHRLTSTHARVRFLTYLTANTVEDRRKEIVDTKFGYHEAVLKGEIAEQSAALRTGDYLYILTGERAA
jgi:hypothetical protein